MKQLNSFGKQFSNEKVMENFKTLKERHPYPVVIEGLLLSVINSNNDPSKKWLNLVNVYMKLGDILMVTKVVKTMSIRDLEEVFMNIVVENIFNNYDIRIRKVIEYLWTGEFLSAKEQLEKLFHEESIDVITIAKKTLSLPDNKLIDINPD
jgi:hypothetical protein